MTKQILVINPNSSEAVTGRIRESIEGLPVPQEVSVEYDFLSDAPAGIETQADIDYVVPLLENRIENSTSDAYILACFSDPGIATLRQNTGKTIYGIGESAYLLSMSLADRFGIIAILPASCERQRVYLKQLGFDHRLAATIPLGLGVSDLEDYDRTLDRILEVSEQLISRGAGVMILGCAGMASYHQKIVDTFGMPVVEPSMAGALFAVNGFHFS